jgi:hypothetical protein
MTFVVETNVALAANHMAGHASRECALKCIHRLNHIMHSERIALDDKWELLGEYGNKLRPSGQPGIGDRFYKWVLRNRGNPALCDLVSLADFPNSDELASFHAKDRKFVRVSLGHPERPPIINATDTDWRPFEMHFAAHGVQIQFLCPDHA